MLKPVRPAPRCAQLGGSLAGTGSLFVIEPGLAKSEDGKPLSGDTVDWLDRAQHPRPMTWRLPSSWPPTRRKTGSP